MVRIYMMLIILLCINCKESEIKNGAESKSVAQAEQEKIELNKKLELGDYSINIENNLEKDTANLLISYNGKKVESYGYKGALSDVITGDINSDGNSEIYFTLISKNKKRLLGMILSNGYPLEMYKAELDEVESADKISYNIKNNQLVERYQMADTAAIKEIKYNLVAGEAGYILKPEGWTPLEIKRLQGIYKKENDKNFALSIKKNDFGEYIVEVTSADCKFSSVGYFLNKDLIAPLNFNNPNLKGKLNVRLMGNLAIVYTLDEKDSKELTTFCKGSKSIAGTFIKTQ